MGEFFHGWRERMGVLALVVACILLAGWMRSLTIRDEIGVLHRMEIHSIVSMTSEVALVRICATKGSSFDMSGPRITWRSVPVSEFPVDAWDTECRRGRGGFEYREDRERMMDLLRQQRLGVPYWSIVVPLALLSACLLLSKPRPSNPTPASESTVVERV